jgi:hypothetical protein
MTAPFSRFRTALARLLAPGSGLAVAGILFLAAATSASAGEKDPAAWIQVSHTPDLTIYDRLHTGTAIKEFKATGLINAEPAVVKRVLDDVEAYPHFMPYVAEARIISHDANSRVAYTRISPPIIGDRDYTIRAHFETKRSGEGGGICYCTRWEAANELGPAEKPGIKRVKITEGSWLLEPAGGGHQTQATYCIYSDSSGTLPAFMVNMASKTAIPKLFESIRNQVGLPKYSGKTP